MINSIKIPEERVAILIGIRGVTKRNIERKTKTKITIGEEILVEGESLDVLVAESIIKAIGRGLAPEKAMLLLDEENTLAVLELPKNTRSAVRIKSRLIGTNGKSRRNIERLTGTYMCVYGKTVVLVGKYSNVEMAQEAIKKIIEGMPHRLVYEFLEGKQNERT